MASNYDARTDYNLGSNKTTAYTTVYFYVAAESLNDNNYLRIVEFQDNASSQCWVVFLEQRAATGQLALWGQYRSAGGNQGTGYSGPVSASAWHKLDVKYDVDGLTYEFRLDETPWASGALSSTTRVMRILRLGDVGSSYEITLHFDLVDVDSSGYIG